MISNDIYQAVVKICEEREHSGTYKGNGHHLAQEITKAVEVALLPKGQRQIFNKLTETYQSTGEVANLTKVHSKTVSTILKGIHKNYSLISMTQKGRMLYWCKI